MHELLFRHVVVTKVASYYMGTHLGYKGVHRDLVTGFSFVLIVGLLFGKWISFIIVLKRIHCDPFITNYWKYPC